MSIPVWGSDIAFFTLGMRITMAIIGVQAPAIARSRNAVQAMEIAKWRTPCPSAQLLKVPGAHNLDVAQRRWDKCKRNKAGNPATKKYEASILSVDCR